MEQPAFDPLREIATIGYEVSNMLSTSMTNYEPNWNGARRPYVWEHNALCWLVRNRAHIPKLCLWTATILDIGYPPEPFRNWQGDLHPAGSYWNKDMYPLAED